jgi:hypothetical protein
MWEISTTERFQVWYEALDDEDRANVLASILVLQSFGPMLGRPHADSVKGSNYKNMKELRIQSKGKPLRAFFAFDPERKAIILCAGKKSGNEKRFYEALIPIADKEYSEHLKSVEEERKNGKKA